MKILIEKNYIGGSVMNFKTKKFFSLFLSLVMVLGLVLASPLTASAEADHEVLHILHVNDIHGNVKGNDRNVIGFERLKTLVDTYRMENDNVLLLDAGDVLHGTTLATLSEGASIVELMNLLGVDAMVPGNHEFNYGYPRLLELQEMAEFPFVAANIVREADASSDFPRYEIFEFEGFKVGVFGLGTEETKEKSHPNNTMGVEFLDPIETSREMVAELEGKVDLIIALAHIGIDEETSVTTVDIAENVEGIHLIVDGHSHSQLDEGLLVNNTLIVQTGEWTKNIGKVEVHIRDGEILAIVPMLYSYEDLVDLDKNQEMVDKIAEIEAINETILERPVGRTLVDLEGAREVVRASESNLGNLITDAMLNLSGADIALTNGGGIRASIPEGDIVLGDVLTAFPFANYPVVIEVSGQDVIDALNHGVDAYPEPAGKFPHVAGMTYEIDTRGEVPLVTNVMVAGEELDLDAMYKLVTNDFMAAGGDGYTMFGGKTILFQYGLLSEVLAEYIEVLEEIDMAVEGRIREYVPALEEVEEETSPAEDIVHIVQPNEVLWRIGRRYNTTWQILAEYNSLKNPNLIFPNQEILIPMER